MKPTRGPMVLCLAIGLGSLGLVAVSQIAGASHVRPKGATPIHVSLVPAYQACTSPNRQHGPPLSHPSCNPPLESSSHVTIGTPDADGAAANSIGSIRLDVIVGAPGPPDDTEVVIKSTISDVRCKPATTACGNANAAGGPDYTGELEGEATIRITDHNNATSPGGGTDAATVIDIPMPFNLTCMSTADTSIGGLCREPTATCLGCFQSYEGTRAVVQVGQIRVFDGGRDGVVATADGETLFAVQGVFVP